jgi:uncharacterized membrane protein
MAHRQTNVKATKKKDGDSEVSVSNHETDTDSPILPVPQLAQLNEFRPDLIDWVITQTQIEAEHRRTQNVRINGYIFFEHIVGQIFALIIGLAGISAGAWVAISGHEWAGGVIATAAITGLAVVFLTGKKQP